MCQPGETRCDASGQRIEWCRPDGLAFQVTAACGLGESCGVIGGVVGCAPATCPASADFCAGGEVWSCGPDGTPDGQISTCGAGEACVGDGASAACSPVVCVPGRTRCSIGDGAVEVCKADGTGFETSRQCAGAEVCVDA